MRSMPLSKASSTKRVAKELEEAKVLEGVKMPEEAKTARAKARAGGVSNVTAQTTWLQTALFERSELLLEAPKDCRKEKEKKRANPGIQLPKFGTDGTPYRPEHGANGGLSPQARETLALTACRGRHPLCFKPYLGARYNSAA